MKCEGKTLIESPPNEEAAEIENGSAIPPDFVLSREKATGEDKVVVVSGPYEVATWTAEWTVEKIGAEIATSLGGRPVNCSSPEGRAEVPKGKGYVAHRN